jgi:uncharacterized repeat protein (TIGR03806 family)
MLSRIALSFVTLGALFAAAVAADPDSAKPPVGIDKRIPLNSSRVIGSPEPPPPYRVRKAFPDLKLNFPIHAVRQPGSDRMLVLTQKNSYGQTKLQRFVDDPKTTDLETILEQNGTAYDVIFHPRFADNGYVYIGNNGPDKKPKKTQVIRYTMDRKPPYKLDPESAKIIIEWESDGHNGGAMGFGPDGLFYVTSGDGTSDSDTNIVGQDMTKLLAKVLRIDVDHPDPGKEYSVPKDNPFVDLKGARPEIWAYGLRNPWRMTVDQKTGHLWVGQNGQDLWEQAFLVKKGDNYGWSVTEGSHPFYPNRMRGPTPIVAPTIEHHHVEFRSLTGGVVYYGARLPELTGAYIYGDYSTGKIWAMKHDGEKPLWHKEVADSRLQISGFAVDGHGELLICDHRGDGKGTLYTLEPNPNHAKPTFFPRTLTETGLFASVKAHTMEPGVIPYSVIAPFWGDNSVKQRWIAMPGGDSRISYANAHGWNFPDETVIVKSFALEMREGDPASKRWIETRFLTRQQGEWFGYSYAWNEEQTEAYLVESKGRDRPLAIAAKAGERAQVWHYPSRTECMVCHSRAANWVLGLQTLQMNKDHDYGGKAANQLRTLDHIGVLKPNWENEAKNALRNEAKNLKLSDKERDEFVKTHLPKEPGIEGFIQVMSADKGRRLVDPYDPKVDLTQRARSYLHVNCAQCHVEAGGGNAAIDLDFSKLLDKMKLIDVPPKHNTFGLKDARLIAPGRPEASVLLHRVGSRGPGQMPPLSTSLVDEPGVEMLRAWVRSIEQK